MASVGVDVVNISRLLELAKCVSCSAVPDAQIFQCTNGHLICRSCLDYPGRVSCPSCGASYFSYNQNGELSRYESRSIIAEEFLDSIRLECENWALGCNFTKLGRGQYSYHAQNCVHRTRTNLCRKLGFNCDFLVDRKQTESAYEHFSIAHAFHQLTHYGLGYLQFNSKCDDYAALTLPKISTVLDRNGSTHILIIIPSVQHITGVGDCLSLRVIQIGDIGPLDDPSFSGKFTIRSALPEVSNLHHSTHFFNFFNYGGQGQGSTVLFPMSYLRERYLFERDIVFAFKVYPSA